MLTVLLLERWKQICSLANQPSPLGQTSEKPCLKERQSQCSWGAAPKIVHWSSQACTYVYTCVHLHSHMHTFKGENKRIVSVLFVWTEDITRCPKLLHSGCAFLCISWSASFHIYLFSGSVSRRALTIATSHFLPTILQSIPLASLLYSSVYLAHELTRNLPSLSPMSL